MSITIGVLGIQGAVEEHIKHVEAAGSIGLIIKKPEQLERIDGLIIPGGESTAMRKIIDRYGFLEPLKQFGATKPVFGTCAGMVLLAKELEGAQEAHLQLMDIKVRRNAFGRQRESFETPIEVKGFDSPFPAVFIRAPLIESAGPDAEVLAAYDGHIVAAKQGHLLACSFHPELTDDSRFMKLFVSMIVQSRQ